MSSPTPGLILTVACGLGAGAGCALGYGLTLADLELPLLMYSVLLSLVPTLLMVQLMGKLQDLPDGLVWPRLLGFLPYSLCLAAVVWGFLWSFDPSWSPVVTGGLVGALGGWGVGVSFGGFGGASRALGMLEAKSMAGWFGGGLLFGLIFSMDEDPSMAPGLAAILAFPALLSGGRMGLMELYCAFDRSEQG